MVAMGILKGAEGSLNAKVSTGSKGQNSELVQGAFIHDAKVEWHIDVCFFFGLSVVQIRYTYLAHWDCTCKAKRLKKSTKHNVKQGTRVQKFQYLVV
jgi:hypothetical protein